MAGARAGERERGGGGGRCLHSATAWETTAPQRSSRIASRIVVGESKAPDDVYASRDRGSKDSGGPGLRGGYISDIHGWRRACGFPIETPATFAWTAWRGGMASVRRYFHGIRLAEVARPDQPTSQKMPCAYRSASPPAARPLAAPHPGRKSSPISVQSSQSSLASPRPTSHEPTTGAASNHPRDCQPPLSPAHPTQQACGG